MMEYGHIPLFSEGMYVNSIFPTMTMSMYRNGIKGPYTKLVHQYDADTIIAE